jgi:NitT/TauT family transport system permease protein
MRSQTIASDERTEDREHMTPPTPIKASSSRRARWPVDSRWGDRALQASFVIIVLAVWSAAHASGVVSSDVLPSVPSVARELVSLVGTGEYWTAVLSTLSSALQGLVIALVVAVPLGLLTGSYLPAERATRVLIDFGRSFPVVALLPVFLLVIGSNGTMKATIVFIACFFPLFLQTQYGAHSVEPMIAETARSFRIPRCLRYSRVVLPSAVPSIMTGLRLATTTAVLVAVGVEILTTLPGIGQMIVQTQIDQNSPRSFAYIVSAALIGYAINRSSQTAENYFLRWRPPASTS